MELRKANPLGRNINAAIFDRVLTVNLVANTAISMSWRAYLLALWFHVSEPQQIIVPILLLHSMRHLGLMFLTRGATFRECRPQFGVSGRIWRSDTAVLAFAAIHRGARSRLAKPVVWFFNIVWYDDLILAIVLATIHNPQLRWGPPTGFQPFGCPCCW